MPICAAYADQVEVEYCDGNTHHLGLMSIIRGEQASNKSVVKNAIDIWKRQFDEEDALARKREEEWKERKKGRKANEKAPEDPHVLIRLVPVTVSCSTLLKRFKNATPENKRCRLMEFEIRHLSSFVRSRRVGAGLQL